MSLGDVIATATAALGARSVEVLDDLTTSGRSTVLRIGLVGSDAETAILKVGAGTFMANWCGLAFLQSAMPGAAPRLLAGDQQGNFVVMEDLGSGPSVKSALASADPAWAEAALIAHAGALGRMAAATRGRRNEYARLVQRLKAPHALLNATPSQALFTDAWAALERDVADVGLRVTPAAARDFAHLCRLWQTPVDAFSFSPGDACADNNVLVDGRVRFFDVDFCSFHPTAFDAAYYAQPHLPTCNYVGQLPADVAERVRAAYAGAMDVDQGEVHLASVAWTTWNAGFLLRRVLTEDGRLGPTTYRQMLLWRLRASAERCRAVGELEGLGALLADLATALGSRWSDVAPMPLYPAWRSQDPEAVRLGP